MESHIMASLRISTLLLIVFDNNMKKDEMDGVYSMHGGK
jgi:hypothetical protein